MRSGRQETGQSEDMASKVYYNSACPVCNAGIKRWINEGCFG